MKKVMIATGGTGGHINPALALADVIKKSESDCEIVFFGSNNRMEAQMIPSRGYRFIGRTMQGMNGGISAKAKSAISLYKAYRFCKKLLKEEQPDICIGFGNYISVPFIMAAKNLGIPTMISEQNSFAGKANKMLAKYVDAIELSYASSGEGMPQDKIRVLGNPEATSCIEEVNQNFNVSAYGLDPSKPFVVFMMGSLGSSSVSKVIDEACLLFDSSFQVLIASGKSNSHQWKNTSETVKVVEYIDGKTMLNQCELAVCRAGATTICEISVLGAASLLIPSPYVPMNHQYYNALELTKNNAAWLLEEKDLNAQSLSEKVNALMKDEKLRKQMKENALKNATPNCAYEMLEWIREIVE